MQLAPQDFELERQLEYVEATIARLELQRDELFAQQRRLVLPNWRERQRRRYLHAARRLRAPAAAFELWPWGVLLVLPASVAALAFILAHALTGSTSAGLIAFAVAAALAAIVTAVLLFVPNTPRLAACWDDLAAEYEQREALRRAIQATTENLRKYVLERDALRAAARARRSQLLKRDWRALREQAWIDYLVEMLLALGAVVKLAGKGDDSGIDLIAEFGPRRVAIHAKTTEHALSDATIRDLLAAQESHQCHAAAVITNGRFQASASRLAATKHCTLIGADNFERFALGDIRL